MSVLLVGNFLSGPRGTRGVCEDLAFRLSAAGHQVTTTSSEPNKVLRILDMLETTWRRRSDYHVALVDLYSGPAFIWAEAVCWVLRKVGKPYALTLHGGSLPEFSKRFPERVRHLLQSAALVTAPSRFLLEEMVQYRPDLCLQPNPLDIGAYQYRHRAHSNPKLVWLRAFHEIYNPSLAARTLSLLLKEYGESSLIMAGPDKGDGSLARFKKRAKQLDLLERVTLHGFVPKSSVPELMNRGDIFINTSGVDNTPVSVLEAMACGLCVVSTNVGGIPYILEDGYDALLVPPDDSQAMAVAVERILNEPGLSASLSANARRKAESFDWLIALPRWRKLLANAARRPLE